MYTSEYKQLKIGFTFKESHPLLSREDWTEADVQRCFYEKMFWKYAVNLQENAHAEVWFQ